MKWGCIRQFLSKRLALCTFPRAAIAITVESEACLGISGDFPLLNRLNGTHYHGSGARGGRNPDGFWEHRNPRPLFPVLMEVGCRQSLSHLRGRTFDLIADPSHPVRRMIIFIKRYRATQRLYMEVWRFNPNVAWGPRSNYVNTGSHSRTWVASRNDVLWECSCNERSCSAHPSSLAGSLWKFSHYSSQ